MPRRYESRMAKKKLAKPMDPHTRLALHLDITEKVTTMIARCGRLRDEGRLDEARRLLVRIERLTKELAQLESAPRWSCCTAMSHKQVSSISLELQARCLGEPFARY